MQVNLKSPWLTALLVLLLASPLIINLDIFDEELLPEVIELLHVAVVPANETDQLLFDLAVDTNAIDDVYQHYPRCTARIKARCLAEYRVSLQQHPAEPGSAFSDVLIRYGEIIQRDSYRGMSNPVDYQPASYWGAILQLNSLYLAQASLTGSAAYADAANRSARFWAMLYRDGQTLMDQVVGIAGLWTVVQFTNDAVEFKDPTMMELIHLIATVDQARLDPARMRAAYRHEFRVFAELLETGHTAKLSDMSTLEIKLASLMLQPYATMNGYYHNIASVALCRTELPRQDMVSSSECPATDSGGFPVYNPAGKALVAVTGTIEDYLYRVHDLRVLASLVSYRLESELGGGAPLEEFIDPSVKIVESAETLAFQCLDQGSRCAI